MTRGHAVLLLISRRSQILAVRQSRATVSTDTCNTSAASSTFNPPRRINVDTYLLVYVPNWIEAVAGQMRKGR